MTDSIKLNYSEVLLILDRNQSGKQFHKANTLQGNFEAAVFFVTEKHSRFFVEFNNKLT